MVGKSVGKRTVALPVGGRNRFARRTAGSVLERARALRIPPPCASRKSCCGCLRGPIRIGGLNRTVTQGSIPSRILGAPLAVHSLVLVSLAAVFMCIDDVLLSRSLFVKRAVSNGRSSCGARAEKVLKYAHQPMLQIPFLVEESISSSLLSHFFRNGAGIRRDDDHGRGMLTPLDVLCRLYPVETWQMNIHQNQIERQRRNLAQCLTSIGRGAYKIKVGRLLQNLGEEFQHKRRIIHDEGPDSGVQGDPFLPVLGIRTSAHRSSPSPSSADHVCVGTSAGPG